MHKQPSLRNERDADTVLNGERALDLITELRFIMRATQLEDWPPSRIEEFRRHLAEVIATVGASQ